MQIKGIGVNAAGMTAAVQGGQDNGNRIQPAGNMFGPEYRVTLSREGRNLSRQQGALGEAGVHSNKKMRMLSRELEKAEQTERDREGYYSELDELERQIKVLNAAYSGRLEDRTYNSLAMKKIAEELRPLREELQELQKEMQELKDFQTEEAQRKLKEAQQLAAMQASRSMEEIDENNRDLVTLLRTIEEAEKAESEQENGGVADEGDAGSGTENSARDAIQNSAAGFMKSSLNRERSVDELADMVGDFGRGFLLKANDIAQNLLKKGASVKEAVGDKSFTDGEIDEMMQNYRSEVKEKTEEADIYGNLGTQIVRYMRNVKLQRIAGGTLQNMQQTKDGMMQAASAAALAEARNSSLDETSGKLADEVEELIDRRNHVDRISQDGGEDGEEQTELIRPKEQESGK